VACYDYDQEIEEAMPVTLSPVKTQFSFAVSGVKANKTRMAEDVVQGQSEPVFRGIQNITLLSYADNPVTGDEAWTPISLPVNDAYPSPDSPTQFYADVEVPPYTSRFLFYGEAKAKGVNKHVNGCLDAMGLDPNTVDWSTSNISFNLRSICGTTSNPKAGLLADYLTNIAKEMETQGLADQYNKLIKNIAGSSVSVLALIKQLYNDIEDNTKKAAVGATISADASGYASTYPGITGNMATIEGGVITDFNTGLKGYPEDIGLPDGAAYMSWMEDPSDNQWKFISNSNHSTILSPNLFSGAALSTYAYPPSLYYWVDSEVRTASTINMYHYTEWLNARQLGYAVNGVQDYDTSWKHFLEMYEYQSGFVNVLSHSVALADEIRYAVGRLDVTVKAASATLKDAQNRQVHFTASAFPITGILIGDQCRVDYDFKQTATPPKTYIIYDTEMPEDMVLSTSGTPVNSTLVLQSRLFDGSVEVYSGLDETSKKNYSVNIAVEFQNNSGFDFYGYYDETTMPDYKPIIPNGTKFYLVGKLEMDAEQAASQGCVFKQGSITHADFVVNSFANAYNVVPDLRNPRLLLGLTANLFWQKGVKLSSPDNL
jgi:hypothetical protein